jgi:hypothetical protein
MALVAYLQAATGRLDRLVATAERLGLRPKQRTDHGQ